jgi:hypothetical protein
MVIYLPRIFHLFCMSNNHCKVYKSIGTLLLIRYRFSDAGFFLALGLNLSKTLGGFNEPLSPSPTGANKLVCFFLVIRINSCKAFSNVTSDRNIYIYKNNNYLLSFFSENLPCFCCLKTASFLVLLDSRRIVHLGWLHVLQLQGKYLLIMTIFKQTLIFYQKLLLGFKLVV